jgi:thiamine biosynthesis lipoprotein
VFSAGFLPAAYYLYASAKTLVRPCSTKKIFIYPLDKAKRALGNNPLAFAYYPSLACRNCSMPQGVSVQIMKKFLTITSLSIFALLLSACNDKKETLISGETMGTTYHIKVVTKNAKNISGLKKKIDQRLSQINRSMSTWLKESEISRFNDFRNVGEKFEISADFLHVMIVAENLYRLTEGAWDGTVNPLVKLWGFGDAERRNSLPPAEKIKQLASDIGFSNIKIMESSCLVKKKPSISLDLGSIAKGYAVDKITELIEQNGIKNFLVEIGGEIYAAGTRKDGKHWKIGINIPRPDALPDQIYQSIAIRNKALATSGDYRDFFEIDGKRYSHIVDPRTGYPVDNGVVSVSVIADNCTFADGLATALMVMGPEKGLALVNRLDQVETFMIVDKDGEGFVDYYSKGFGGDNLKQ